jgi:hypothetical protein
MADGTLYSIIVPRKPFNDEGKWTKGSLGNRAVVFWTYGPKTDFKPVLSRGSTTLSYIANGEHSYLEVSLRGQSPLDMAQLDFRVQKGPNGLPPAVTLVRPHDLTVTASMILNLNEADFESIYKINAKQLLMHALAGCTIY